VIGLVFLGTTDKSAYSQNPKSRPSGFRMAIFWTLFESGYRMQNGGQSIKKPDKFVRFSNAKN
jgi:hypothetical protein